MSFRNKIALEFPASFSSSTFLSNIFEKYRCSSENRKAIQSTTFLTLVRKTWRPKPSNWRMRISFPAQLSPLLIESSTSKSRNMIHKVYVRRTNSVLGSTWHELCTRPIFFVLNASQVWLPVIAVEPLISIWPAVTFRVLDGRGRLPTSCLGPIQDEWANDLEPKRSMREIK